MDQVNQPVITFNLQWHPLGGLEPLKDIRAKLTNYYESLPLRVGIAGLLAAMEQHAVPPLSELRAGRRILELTVPLASTQRELLLAAAVDLVQEVRQQQQQQGCRLRETWFLATHLR